jgi:hypothetical protein
MSDDLVKRLRDWSEYDEGKINDAREEAADLIEQLEAAMRKIIDAYEYSVVGPCQINIARAALREKKDG